MRERLGEHLSETKKALTGFLAEPVSRPELVLLLAEAGLELWQAPEGFWTVRLKQAAQAAPVVRLRRRALRRTK
jgi:hypothetical protein